MRTAMRLVLCIASVWVCWSVHDFLQERIFRVKGFRFGFFMSFVLQLMSFSLAALSRAVARLSHPASQPQRQREALKRANDEEGTGLLAEEAEPAEGVPLSSLLLLYLLLSCLIAAANGTASAALLYVNMPVKVLCKSSKIITVMLIGSLFGQLYPLAEYGYMLLTTTGLASFLLAGSVASLRSSLVGVSLLALAVLADSLVPNVQQRLLQGLRRSKEEVVFHTNWISALLTLGYILFTGELIEALIYLRGHRRVVLLLLLQSTAGYFGIIAYLETVRSFGPKVTVVVTSCRKLFTLALSSVVFHHPISGFHLVGIGAVFAGVLFNANGTLRCSRMLIVPTLALMLLVLAAQLTAGSVESAAAQAATAASGMAAAKAPATAELTLTTLTSPTAANDIASWCANMLQPIRSTLGTRLMN